MINWEVPDQKTWEEMTVKSKGSVIIQLGLFLVLYYLKPELFINYLRFPLVEIPFWTLIPSVLIARIVLQKKLRTVNSNKYALWLSLVFISGIAWSSFFYGLLSPELGLVKEHGTLGYILIAGFMSAAGINFSLDFKSFCVYIATIAIPIYTDSFLEVLLGETPIKGIYLTILMVFLIQQRRISEKMWVDVLKSRNELDEIINSFPGAISIFRDKKYLFANNQVENKNRHCQAFQKSSPFDVSYEQTLVGKELGSREPHDPIVQAYNKFLKKTEEIEVIKKNKNLFPGSNQLGTDVSFIEDLNSGRETSPPHCYVEKVQCCNEKEMSSYLVYLTQLKNENFLAVSLDISEKVALEEKLQHERIRSQNSAKLAALGEMSSGISHEINNPLAIIFVAVQRLEKLLQSEVMDREKLKLSVERISRMSERIATIVRGLQRFAKEGDSEPLEKASIQQILKETLVLCESRFASRGVRLDYEFSNSPIFIQCRSVQISQALLNIFSNSLDAAQKGHDGLDPWVRIILKDLGEEVSIIIQDSGAGFSEEGKIKAMQPFYTTKEPGHGTGLGLSVSKGIIEEHSGKLYFDFNQKFTTCVITLPKSFDVDLFSSNVPRALGSDVNEKEIRF